MLTAYVAQAFAAQIKKSARADTKQNANDSNRQKFINATKRALDYLSRCVDEIDEPYLIAAYALAARDADEGAKAEHAVKRLRALVHDENGASYWSLETNTPFYSWGLAGRIETTALVVRALAAKRNVKLPDGNDAATRRQGGTARQQPSESTTQERSETELLNRGLLFLLRHKDRYGVWHSTQATINVLDALTTVLSQRQAKPSDSKNQKEASTQAEIIVNGKRIDSLTMPNVNQLTNPLMIDISKFLSSGKNLVEIRRPVEASQASAQIVETHYENWSSHSAKPQSNALRFAVNFEKTQAQTSDEIICKVEAERVGFRGYGMLLAEIGLPPGAEVDRASLELAMTKSNWQINQYEVLPDRVVFYLWAYAGGSQFEFKFRPRFGIEAKTAASVLYDYYNPEARVVVAPVKFKVE